MTLAAHGVTHSGRRASNEDSLLVDPALGLFVVADGMGGHRAGEIASDLAIETIRKVMAGAGKPTGELLRDAVRRANEDILVAASRSDDYSGMGTTVTAALVQDGGLACVSVGDSRMYRLRNGVLTQLTNDDSWLSYARASGAAIDDDEAQRHPMRHVLTEVVGVRPELVPELQVDSLQPGDRLLLCSDGLHGVLPLDRLTMSLQANSDPAAAAQSLVDEALASGSLDNVTAIVVTCG